MSRKPMGISIPRMNLNAQKMIAVAATLVIIINFTSRFPKSHINKNNENGVVIKKPVTFQSKAEITTIPSPISMR